MILLDMMYKTREGSFDSYESTLDYITYYAYLSTGGIDELYLTFIEKLYIRLNGNIVTLSASLRLYTPEYQYVLKNEGYIQAIKGLQNINVFDHTTSIHHLSEHMRPIITQMLMFSPRSRYSINDLLLDPFFVEVRNKYQNTVYDQYKPEVKGLFLDNREVIIRQMVDLIMFMKAKYVHLLNAIYIFDQWS